jgi:hypothetical protein
MTQPYIENTDIYPIPLDESPGISLIGPGGLCACFGLSVILMSNPAVIPPKATFDVVIGYLREVRAGFEQAVSGLDHQPADAALGYANGMKAGLDTTLITLEHLARLTAGAAQIDPLSPGQSKPGFATCPECGSLYGRHARHICYRENEISPNDLDAIFGKDEWVDLPAAQQDEASPIPVPQSEPRPLGMREGSKKHRVYEATRKLLEQNGPMHIDAMLEGVKALGVFEAVKDPRINFANILSALRSKRLVDSDNRGTYSLPNGKAAE